MFPRRSLLPMWLSLVGMALILNLRNIAPVRAETIRLNRPLPNSATVGTFTISNDLRRVVYEEQIRQVPSPDSDLLATLYSVSFDGKSPEPISYPTITDEFGLRYLPIQPGSRFLFYLGQKQNGDRSALYKVPISGPISATLQLSKGLPAGWYITSFRISKNEKWAIYQADYAPNLEIEQSALYAVSTAGPADSGVKLKVAIPTGDYLTSYSIMPDEQHLVYAVSDGSDQYIFYSISLIRLDSKPIQLSPPLRSHDDYLTDDGGQRLLYFEDKPPGQYGSRAIFSVPISGPQTAGVQLTLEPVPGLEIGDYSLSPNSHSLIYSLYPPTSMLDSTLYRVPLTGPAEASIPLNDMSTGGQYIDFYGSGLTFQVTPDGQYLLYKARRAEFGESDIYSVPMNGPISATVQLSDPQIPGGGIVDYALSKDSQWLVYLGDQSVDNQFELYHVPVVGPANRRIKLNGELAASDDVGNFLITPDRQWVIYQTEHFSGTNPISLGQLYLVPSSGPADASIPLTDANATISDMAATSDSRKVVYLQGQGNINRFELYAVDLPEPAMKDVMFLSGIQH